MINIYLSDDGLVVIRSVDELLLVLVSIESLLSFIAHAAPDTNNITARTVFCKFI
jgi:hypothetical protein